VIDDVADDGSVVFDMQWLNVC